MYRYIYFLGFSAFPECLAVRRKQISSDREGRREEKKEQMEKTQKIRKGEGEEVEEKRVKTTIYLHYYINAASLL